MGQRDKDKSMWVDAVKDFEFLMDYVNEFEKE
jgi:hypothetical protein